MKIAPSRARPISSPGKRIHLRNKAKPVMKHAWMMVAALLASGTAMAQDPKPDVVVSSTDGSVQLPTGNAIEAGGNAGLDEGQTVQVTGTATITYPNGCQVTVSNQAYTINQASCVPSSAPVRGAMAAETKYVLMGLGAAAVIGVAAGGSDDDKPSSP